MRGRAWCRLVATVGVLATVATAALPAPSSAQTVRDLQWHLSALQVPEAQQISTGQGVPVAVVDTGIDAGNPDLAGRLIAGMNEDDPWNPAGAGVDNDGHGTSMAGTIAGTGADGGPLGIAPGAQIMPIRAAKYRDATTPDGIKWAAEHGAKVINVSSSEPGMTNGLMQQAIDEAMRHDAVVVAGAGNVDQGEKDIGVPANYPGVIAVTGTDKSGSFWSGSAQGPEAVIAAPAVGIVSTTSRQSAEGQQSYAAHDGTSDATAIVSGVVALIRAKYPNLNAANVINRLIKTADEKGPAGRDPQYGYGQVDPVRALTANVPQVASNPLVKPSASAGSSHAAGGAAASGGSEKSGGFPVWLILLLIAVVLVALVMVLALVLRGRRRRMVQAAPQPPPMAGGSFSAGGQNGPTTDAPSPPGWQSGGQGLGAGPHRPPEGGWDRPVGS